MDNAHCIYAIISAGLWPGELIHVLSTKKSEKNIVWCFRNDTIQFDNYEQSQEIKHPINLNLFWKPRFRLMNVKTY